MNLFMLLTLVYLFCSEKKEVRRLAVWGVINVVKATWLEECDQAKKELAVSTKHLASELLFSKGVGFTCLLKSYLLCGCF